MCVIVLESTASPSLRFTSWALLPFRQVADPSGPLIDLSNTGALKVVLDYIRDKCALIYGLAATNPSHGCTIELA